MSSTANSAPASQRATSSLVQLSRFVTLNDRFQTSVFTFLLPSHLIRAFLPEAVSKEFLYANQLWHVRFLTNGNHLGAYLELPGLLAGCQVKVDYQFTVLNCEHFTKNESFGEREAVFHCDCAHRGRATFMELHDLRARRFLYDDWRCVVELEVRACTTSYMEEMLLPRDSREVQQLQQLESSCFTYGGTDWSVFIDLSRGAGGNSRVASMPCQLTLRRHGKNFQECRFTYRANVSWSGGGTAVAVDQQRQDTGNISAHADVHGETRPMVRLDDAFQQTALQPRGRITVRVEMGALTWMSRMEVFPLNRSRNYVRCVDHEQRAWLLQSDVLGRLVTLRFFYQDAQNLPPHHTRLVAWNATLVPWNRQKPLVQACFPPYSGYFVAGEEPEAQEVTMNLPVEEVCDNQAGYVNPETGGLCVQVDWLHSYVLYQDKYSIFDDNMRLHRHQMTREVATLQSENLALEKQVHSYQLSIAKKNSGLDDPHMSSTSSGSFERPTNSPAGDHRKASQHGAISTSNSSHRNLGPSPSPGNAATRQLPQPPAPSSNANGSHYRGGQQPQGPAHNTYYNSSSGEYPQQGPTPPQHHSSRSSVGVVSSSSLPHQPPAGNTASIVSDPSGRRRTSSTYTNRP